MMVQKVTAVEGFSLHKEDPLVREQVSYGYGRFESLFPSVEQARGSNCHNIYKDRAEWRVGRYRITTTVECLDPDVDPPSQEEIAAWEAQKVEDAYCNEQTKGMGIRESMAWRLGRRQDRMFPFDPKKEGDGG